LTINRSKENLDKNQLDRKISNYIYWLIFLFRRQFCKSTTCDISSDDISPNENNLESSKSTPMNRIRHGGTRRFSLVKLEVTSGDSNTLTTGFIHWKILFISSWLTFNLDDSKAPAPSSSPNLIQKLLFRQFSPKTRPYSSAIGVGSTWNYFFSHSKNLIFQSDDSPSSSNVSNDTLKWVISIN
jgi:hypothetical protein